MKKIELEPYEEKDILSILNYAQEEYKYRSKFDKSGLPNYWVQRIEQLKKIIKGEKIPRDIEIQSSLVESMESNFYE